MYEKYYKLERTPFNATPDPAFFYTSPSHREALAALIYGIQYRKGFIALIGEVGTGKTTVLRSYIHSRYARNVKTIYVFNPKLSYDDLLTIILREFTNDIPEAEVKKVDLLHRYLVAYYEKGVNVVIIIDEAQNMPVGTLESMRMLSNIETTQHKLIQIVLSGQPELETVLASHSLRQLRQRLALTVRIQPLTDEESIAYIDHRVAQAGGSDALFTQPALAWIVRNAGGIPRKINTICDNALVSGYGTDRFPVDVDVLREIAADLRLQGVDPEILQSDAIETEHRWVNPPYSNGDRLGKNHSNVGADYRRDGAHPANTPDSEELRDDNAQESSASVAERTFLKDAKKAFEEKHGIADMAEYDGVGRDVRLRLSAGESIEAGLENGIGAGIDEASSANNGVRSHSGVARPQVGEQSQHAVNGHAVSKFSDRLRNERLEHSGSESDSPPLKNTEQAEPTPDTDQGRTLRPISQLMENLDKPSPKADRGPRKFW